MALVQKSLDFESLSAEAVRFVPVDFGIPDMAVFQSDAGLAFELAPSSRAILFAKAEQVTYASAFSDDFNVGYIADNLERHGIPNYQRWLM
jgi:hypothetical protein